MGSADANDSTGRIDETTELSLIHDGETRNKFDNNGQQHRRIDCLVDFRLHRPDLLQLGGGR